MVGREGKIIKTMNGGSTWTIQSGGTNENLWSVCFPDANNGYAVGNNGTILKTNNGGTGLSDLSSKLGTLNVYPNPSSNFVTIETSSVLTPSRLSILNLSGQELLQKEITETKTTIDISTIRSGVYVVRLTSKKTVEIGKIIKQ